MRPRAVFFDLDDTLIDRAGAFARYVDDLLDRHPSVLSSFSRHEAIVWLQVLDGRGYVDRAVFCQAATLALPGLGLSPQALWTDLSSRLPRFVQPRPRVRRLVEDTCARAAVAVVSNGSGRVQRAKLARAGLDDVLPQVFISGEVGAEKPDPRLFHAALSRMGFAAADVLHVGDDPERDIVGASRLGIATCWVSDGREWPASLPPPMFTVARVEDVAGVLS